MAAHAFLRLSNTGAGTVPLQAAEVHPHDTTWLARKSLTSKVVTTANAWHGQKRSVEALRVIAKVF